MGFSFGFDRPVQELTFTDTLLAIHSLHLDDVPYAICSQTREGFQAA